jgi:hypothetical protein
MFGYESIRESIVISIFILAFPTINRNRIKYFLCCLVAINFHYGAFILFFIPLFYQCRLTIKKIIFLCILVLFSIRLVIEMVRNSQVSWFSAAIEYRFSVYINRPGLFTPYTILTSFIIPSFLLVVGRFNKERNREYDGMILLYFVFTIGSFGLGILMRFTNYFVIFYLLFISNDVISYFIDRHINTPIKIIWSYALVSICIMQFVLWFFVGVPHSSYKNYHKYFPYHSVFSERKSLPREEIKYLQFR